MGAHELAFVGLAGSGLGTALSLPMMWPRPKRSREARLLGTAVLLTSAIAALISARVAGLVPAGAAVHHAINGLGLCAIPTLVLYTWYATAAPVTTRRVAWLWAPAVGYLATAVSRSVAGLDSRVPFAWLLPVLLGFTAVSIATLWRHRDARRAPLVPAEWVVGFVVLVNIAQVVRMEFGHVAAVRALVPLALSLGFLAIAAYGAWLTFAADSSVTTTVSAPRYERSGLEPVAARDLLNRLERVMTRDRLFTQADLTLAQLAASIDSTPHQVSEVLNRYAGVSYHEMINRRRVEDVKAQLLDPDSDRYTIEGIGGSAGFASRSALYAAFKRFEGTTPTVFRSAHRRTGSPERVAALDELGSKS